MMKRILPLLVLLAFSAPALATDEVPDLMGNWTGVAVGIIRGPSDFVRDISAEETRFSPVMNHTLIIEEQKDRRFVGERLRTDKPENSEAIIGVIGFDNQTLYMVDEDGYISARMLSPTEMELVYREVDPEGMLVYICKYVKV